MAYYSFHVIPDTFLMLVSCSVMFDSLQPHGLWQVRLPGPSLFAQTHVHWVDDAIQPSHPLPPPSYPALNISIKIFSNELALCIRWSKYLNFSFSISTSNENLELISFRIDLFDLLAVQGTLKSLLQNHSSKTSIL